MGELVRRTLSQYDLEISLDDTIQLVSKQDVIHGPEIISQISVQYTEKNTINDKTDLDGIHFIVIHLYYNEESLYLFKRYVHPNTAYKTSLKYTIDGGVLKPFNDARIISINSYVDAILFKDLYYIFNRNSFNSFFNYKDIFKGIITNNTKVISDSGLLTDSCMFITDCESDGRYLPRLTKAILAEGFQEVSKRKSELANIVHNFNLQLKLSADGSLVYTSKADIPAILNILLRHYVIDALTNDNMIAAAIQQYKVQRVTS